MRKHERSLVKCCSTSRVPIVRTNRDSSHRSECDCDQGPHRNRWKILEVRLSREVQTTWCKAHSRVSEVYLSLRPKKKKDDNTIFEVAKGHK